MKRYLKYLLVAALLVSCSPQSKSWWDKNYTHKVGDLPTDVCIQNGIPVIYGMTSESDGDVGLIYLRNDGDVTMKHYPPNLLGTDWKEGGEFYFTGGTCPQ